MAHIIENHEGLSHHAPLSHAQSVAIARHLQEQINQLNLAIHEVANAHEDTSSKVQDLTTTLHATNSDVQVLQDGLSTAKGDTDSNKRALQRTAAGLQQLQADFGKASEDISKLQEGQCHAEMEAQKMSQQLADAHALALKVQESLQKCNDDGIVQLRNEMSRQELDLLKLKSDSQQSQASAQGFREAFRDADGRMKGLRDQLAAAETQVQIDRRRLDDTVGGLKKAQEDVNNVAILVTTLREDHERTKEQLSEARGGVKKVGARAKSLQEGLMRTTKDLEVTADRLEQAIQKLDTLDTNLVQVHDETRCCTQTGETARVAINRLNGEVRELQATTYQVRAGLKETTSLLLPNIHQDSAEARIASARHGSLLGGSLGGLAAPPMCLSSPGRASPVGGPTSPSGGGGRGAPAALDVTRRPSEGGLHEG